MSLFSADETVRESQRIPITQSYLIAKLSA